MKYHFPRNWSVNVYLITDGCFLIRCQKAVGDPVFLRQRIFVHQIKEELTTPPYWFVSDGYLLTDGHLFTYLFTDGYLFTYLVTDGYFFTYLFTDCYLFTYLFTDGYFFTYLFTDGYLLTYLFMDGYLFTDGYLFAGDYLLNTAMCL